MKKKSFDCVAFMRKRREEIDHEDEGLSWAEKRKKTRRIIENDPLWQRLKDRVVPPFSHPPFVVREPETKYDESDD